MKYIALTLVAAILLAGCKTAAPGAARLSGSSDFSARAIVERPSTGEKKIATPLPQPEMPRQGLTKQNVQTIAASAYLEAFNAKTPVEAMAIAKLALEKIHVVAPFNSSVQGVLRYAHKAIAETDVSDPENARRIALWPLHFLKKGVGGVKDPMFFEMTATMMESMVNWQDGLKLGLVTINFLEDHPDGYVKTMVAKAAAKFRNPKITLEESYKLTLQTFKDIHDTLATIGK